MLFATASAAQDTASPFAGWKAETWVYFRNNSESTDGSQQAKATLRLYQPFPLGRGWHLTMREDIPGIYTNQVGQDNLTQQWNANIGDIFVQASLATPPIAPGLSSDLGLRVYFPTGGLKPFGDGSYRIAPHFGFDWTIPGTDGRFGFAPLARYVRSIGYFPPHYTGINQVQFHPVVRAKISEAWMFTMWQEKEIIYDVLTQGWFVPLGFMVHWQALPSLSIALGAARSFYASYPQYENMVYGRLSFTF
jgi:hypothetical protein